jgi:hypothetical protein
MKNVIIENHWLFKIWFMKNYSGMAVTPNLIICRGEAYDSLIRHERIHQEQMSRHGYLLFLLLYLYYYLSGLVKYRSHWKAYRNNPFEVEARNV